MNIQLSVYEVFSRTIPGGVYLVAIGQLMVIAGLARFDLEALNGLSFFAILCLLVVAYILGSAFDRFSLTWFQLFQRRGHSARSFAEFKKKHQDRWDIRFGDADLPTLLAIIRTRNLALISDLDRQNSLSVMLRNVSLATMLLTLNQILLFLLSQTLSYLIFGLAFFILSILLIRDAVRYRGWYYSSIFEIILAYRIDLEQAIRPVNTALRRGDDAGALGRGQ